ncbi:MAG: alpha/beta hydrolase [Frankiaceae bacterium]
MGSGTQPGAGTSTGCGQPPSADTPPAVSLRGHGGSGGGERLSRAGIRDYMHDVVQTIVRLPAQPVLVGHSIGGLVVQRVLERYPVRAGVLISPVPGHSGHRLAHNVTRRYPGDLVRVPRRTRPSKAPILVLGSPDDRLKPLADMRQVAGNLRGRAAPVPRDGPRLHARRRPAGATGCVAGLGGGHRAEPASGRWREGRGEGERPSRGAAVSSPSCTRENGHPAPVTRSHPSLVTMSGLVYSDSSSRSRVPAKELWWLPGTGRTRWRWQSSPASSNGPCTRTRSRQRCERGRRTTASA